MLRAMRHSLICFAYGDCYGCELARCVALLLVALVLCAYACFGLVDLSAFHTLPLFSEYVDLSAGVRTCLRVHCRCLPAAHYALALG